MIWNEMGTGAEADTETEIGTTPYEANLSDPVFTDSALGLFAEHDLFTVFPSGLIRLTPAGRHYYRDSLAAIGESRAPDAEVETATQAKARATVHANEEAIQRADPEATYPIDQVLHLIYEGEKRVARNAQRHPPPVVIWGPLVDALHDRLASALLVEKDVEKAAQLVERSKTMIAHIERIRDGIDPNQAVVAPERDRDSEKDRNRDGDGDLNSDSIVKS
jgi:hypothetical protein